jgi:hypothetical protein
MNSNVVITTVLIPGFVSVLLFLVFTYLYEQSRQPYFRRGNGLGALLAALRSRYLSASSPAFLASELLLVVMALCIFVSTRLMRGPYRFRWYDAGLGALRSGCWPCITLRGHIVVVFSVPVQPAIVWAWDWQRSCCIAPPCFT